MSSTTPTQQTEESYDNRETFADELALLARKDDRIVVVCNDSVGSSKLAGFKEEFGERLINVGIAEQNLVGVGAGLANGGMTPFVSSAAPFLTGRALEQIKADIAYSQYPVILCGQSPGMAYGELGPTHHSVEDLAWLRPLPGLDIIVPADREETRQALQLAARRPGPTYLRIGRHKVPDVNPPDLRLERGRWTTLRQGDDVAIIAIGTMVSRALVAAETLAAAGITARVVNAAYISPLDQESLDELARSVRAIVTVEEANTAGGLGAAVATHLVQQRHRNVSTRVLGLSGKFAPTGSNDYLLEHFGLSSQHIVAAAKDAIDNG